MALVKYREYEIEQTHLDRSIAPSCPIAWLRERFGIGDKLGIFIDSENQDQLIIKKVEPLNQANGESIPA